VIPCPNCGQDNPEGFRFCGFCATPLHALSPPRIDERRVVTVLFCDLVGFTARSDRADPEDVKATLRPYHERLKREIEAFGGTLDKFIGDGVLGVFGAPTAHEDDPERAVRAAIAIQDALREMNEARPGLNLAARAGIATGEAVVAFGAGPQIGESVTGDIVNTASRIQSVAPVGGILVGDRTYVATKDRIEYEELEPVTVKGKADPLDVWRVTGARAGAAELDRRHMTDFVGRGAERALLKDAFLRTVQERSARLVTIIGLPGVGKSRLVEEAQSDLRALAGTLTWRQGRCLPYGEGITFWAIAEVVKAQAGILESDLADARDAKLTAALAELGTSPSEAAWLHGRLAPLVGLEASLQAVDREESFAAWRRFLDAVAGSAPLVLAIDDLHWADPAALAFIEGLVGRPSGGPILIIGTARPELLDRNPEWCSDESSSMRVALSPLSDEETAQLVSRLLDLAGLPPETRAQIVERTGGNPLYAEEFARMMVDRGLLAADLSTMALPDSIQALIAARLDTLTPERKGIQQDASVIGKVFWSGAVAALGEADEQAVRGELDVLAEREFVRPQAPSTIAGQLEYAFRHGLIRDVAYAQIPRASRADKHRAAAGWIEAAAPGRVAELAEILVHHTTTSLELFRAAGHTSGMEELEADARRYLRLAGSRAMALDVARAETYLRRALDLTPEGSPDLPAIRAGLGEAAFQGGRHDEATVLFESAVEGFRSLGRTKEMADAMIRLSVMVEYGGDPARGRSILSDAIRLLEGLPPGEELARALAESAGTLMVAGLYTESVDQADRAIELARTVGEAEAEARAHNFRGYCRVVLGDLDALAELRESVDTARALGLGRATAVSYSNLGAALLFVEGPQASLACGREGVAFADARGLVEMAAFLRNGILTTLVSLGKWDEALRLGAFVAEGARKSGAEYEEVFAEADRVQVLVRRGEPGAAQIAESLLERARPMEDPPLLAGVMTIAALARQANGDQAGAMALVDQVIETTQEDGAVTRAADVCDLVRLALGAGRNDLVARAMHGVEDLVLPRHRHAVLAARAEIAEAEGKLEAAAELFDQAAARWEEFGQVLDRGYALFGAGRCMARLGMTDDARGRFLAARELFDRLVAAPLSAEVDTWLEGGPAPGTIAT
jgi:class 3 adenylate cyclase/tetratricopeptide (TPR) repeat protein